MASTQIDNHHIYANGGNASSELPKLTTSASFKVKKKPIAAPGISRAGSEVDEFVTLLHGSDPIRVELNRLENELRGLFSKRSFSLFIYFIRCCWNCEGWIMILRLKVSHSDRIS